MFRYLAGFVCLAIFSGCAAKQPVLYPNVQYKSVGEAAAKIDIDTCMKLADESGTNSDKGSDLAAQTGKSVVVGGATGAIVGAI